ncbi:unnamed protein product [Phytomonas sp. EM1]|nr:unnamed protein product [Phytomonas sp. EM1]|eukprot:CCW65177.1 unnamed protein product [Phytomonas sp. isolate EM1]
MCCSTLQVAALTAVNSVQVFSVFLILNIQGFHFWCMCFLPGGLISRDPPAVRRPISRASCPHRTPIPSGGFLRPFLEVQGEPSGALLGLHYGILVWCVCAYYDTGGRRKGSAPLMAVLKAAAAPVRAIP